MYFLQKHNILKSLQIGRANFISQTRYAIDNLHIDVVRPVSVVKHHSLNVSPASIGLPVVVKGGFLSARAGVNTEEGTANAPKVTIVSCTAKKC